MEHLDELDRINVGPQPNADLSEPNATVGAAKMASNERTEMFLWRTKLWTATLRNVECVQVQTGWMARRHIREARGKCSREGATGTPAGIQCEGWLGAIVRVFGFAGARHTVPQHCRFVLVYPIPKGLAIYCVCVGAMLCSFVLDCLAFVATDHDNAVPSKHEEAGKNHQ